MTKIKCMICGKELHKITQFHLKKHNLSMKEYREKYPGAPIISEEFREKNSNAQKKYFSEHPEKIIRGEKHYLYGKHPSAETIEKMILGNKGENNGMYGRHHTEESKRKMSETKGELSEEVRKKMSDAHIGIKLSETTKQNMSKASRGRKKSDSHCKHISEGKKKYYQEHPEASEEFSKCVKGKKRSKETKRKNSNTHKQLWQNPEFVRKMFAAWNVKPNKPEKLIYSILQNILPGEYKINVTGEVMTLGRKIPDFVNVNGQKKLIEFNGCFFHYCPVCYPDSKIDGIKRTEERIKLFKKYGWSTLVIWEHELEDMEAVVNRILEFHNLPSLPNDMQLCFDNNEETKK